MRLRTAARAALGSVLCVFVALASANGQNAPPNLKEVQVADGSFSLGDPIPSWVETVAVPDAGEIKPIIVRLADTQWLVGDIPVVHVHRAIMVNDAASLTSAGQLSIQFNPQYQRLQLHAIHVLRADKSEDRTTSSTIRFLQRETGLERGVYSGITTASVLVNDLRVGDTIELSYSLSGQNPVFGGKFVSSVVWDQGYPTLLRHMVFTYPAARKISWRLVGDTSSKPLAPEESVHDGLRSLRFEEKSIPDVAIEQFAPADYSPFRVMQFSEFSEWNDVVSWANDLFQVNDAAGDEFQKVVEKLRDLPGSEQRVAAALEFVQSEIRYFSVALGESSHRPTPPNIVLQRRYGDCKDKSLLLISLLKALGIQSEPVLLDALRRKTPAKLLPSPLAFDHAIVRVDVDGKVFYLDPTRLGQHGRLDRMGQSHEGAAVLVIASGTRELATIASPNAFELTWSERSETATLPKLGPDGSLQTRQTWNGVSAEVMRVTREHLPAGQFDKLFGESMQSRYPGAKLTGELQVDDDRVNNIVSVAATYDVPGLATENAGNWFVRYIPSNMQGALLPPPPSGRTAPFIVRSFPLEARYTFEVKFPEEVSAVADPRSATVEGRQFTYAVTASFRGNQYKIAIDLKTLADRVETADLQKYGEDVRAANNLARGVVVVTKEMIKSPAAADKTSFAQHLRDVLQEGIDKYTKTIDSGKLAANDLADAYCQRSANYVSLDMMENALRDANEALKLAPNNPQLSSCRAEAYFRGGEFDKSIADYSKAIALGATDAEFFRGRGVSEVYAGRLDSAADDFAKASAAADKESQTYIDLWLTWSLQRLGKPLPEALATRATDSHGDWPRPALAMLVGNITPEAMLAALDSKTGDARQMALAEANFYLGQHYLTLGDVAQARVFFEKTRQSEVIIYYEYTAAAFELKRLQEASKN
jgi:lipoprotein NlpI/transglutaminase-like putative cysteine protease